MLGMAGSSLGAILTMPTPLSAVFEEMTTLNFSPALHSAMPWHTSTVVNFGSLMAWRRLRYQRLYRFAHPDIDVVVAVSFFLAHLNGGNHEVNACGLDGDFGAFGLIVVDETAKGIGRVHRH